MCACVCTGWTVSEEADGEAVPAGSGARRATVSTLSDLIAAVEVVEVAADGTGSFSFPWNVPGTLLPSRYGAWCCARACVLGSILAPRDTEGRIGAVVLLCGSLLGW